MKNHSVLLRYMVCGLVFLATFLKTMPVLAAAANPLFVFDNGLNDEAHRTLAAKASLLQELGYAGVGWRPGEVPEMRAELEKRSLRMFTLYTGARIGSNEQKYDPNLPKIVEQLKGSGALIWLTLTSNQDPPSAAEGDIRAVAVINEIADLAEPVGLKLALYPHYGMWLEKVQDAVRIARKVDRPNVGATFNLCHCLKVGDEAKIPELLRQAKPYLFVVSINGADSDGQDWRALIQTLDRGTFNQANLLKQLQAVDYTGPIGLQCYNIQGDVRDNLTRSMQAWRKLNQSSFGHEH